MPARSPADVIECFAAHLSASEIDELLELYEPDATYVVRPGRTARGEAIRAAFVRLRALRPCMSGRCEQVTEAGDIALVRNRWELRGQQPDGQPVESGGLSMVVLRRRPDGTWGVVIDDPWGS
jgi:ketosteroid isomerase-like protein